MAGNLFSTPQDPFLGGPTDALLFLPSSVSRYPYGTCTAGEERFDPLACQGTLGSPGSISRLRLSLRPSDRTTFSEGPVSGLLYRLLRMSPTDRFERGPIRTLVPVYGVSILTSFVRIPDCPGPLPLFFYPLPRPVLHPVR